MLLSFFTLDGLVFLAETLYLLLELLDAPSMLLRGIMIDFLAFFLLAFKCLFFIPECPVLIVQGGYLGLQCLHLHHQLDAFLIARGRLLLL